MQTQRREKDRLLAHRTTDIIKRGINDSRETGREDGQQQEEEEEGEEGEVGRTCLPILNYRCRKVY